MVSFTIWDLDNLLYLAPSDTDVGQLSILKKYGIRKVKVLSGKCNNLDIIETGNLAKPSESIPVDLLVRHPGLRAIVRYSRELFREAGYVEGIVSPGVSVKGKVIVNSGKLTMTEHDDSKCTMFIVWDSPNFIATVKPELAIKPNIADSCEGEVRNGQFICKYGNLIIK
jgi:hypothetical protein